MPNACGYAEPVQLAADVSGRQNDVAVEILFWKCGTEGAVSAASVAWQKPCTFGEAEGQDPDESWDCSPSREASLASTPLCLLEV